MELSDSKASEFLCWANREATSQELPHIVTPKVDPNDFEATENS